MSAYREQTAELPEPRQTIDLRYGISCLGLGIVGFLLTIALGNLVGWHVQKATVLGIYDYSEVINNTSPVTSIGGIPYWFSGSYPRSIPSSHTAWHTIITLDCCGEITFEQRIGWIKKGTSLTIYRNDKSNEIYLGGVLGSETWSYWMPPLYKIGYFSSTLLVMVGFSFLFVHFESKRSPKPV